MNTATQLEYLFSYGTLQDESVQMATFGRKLVGNSDTLPCYRQTQIPIKNPALVVNGAKYHFNLEFTGQDSDYVTGMVFEVTKSELAQADIYEREAEYQRINVQLKSGIHCWVYLYK